MPLAIRAFPLHRPVDELLEFASALTGPRAAEAGKFYRQYGVEHESWHLQDTPQGPWVIVVTRAEEVKAAPRRFAETTDEFDSWFKAHVQSLSGVDLNTAPLGPPTTEVFAWSDNDKPGSNQIA